MPVEWHTRPRVLVTGASGFVGGRVVEAMQLSGAAEPVAAVRTWSRAARIARRPCEVAICDILDPDQVESAVARVNWIVHCAYTDDRESIVDGTRNLLMAAARHDVQRFVFLSSAEVYGNSVRGTVTETAPTLPTGRLYADAKIEAEAVCRQEILHGRRPTILRPSLIYGPFGSSWSVDVARRLQSGNWGIFEGYGHGIANLVYVDDLVQAILLSLHHSGACGETFNINGPDELTWNEYFRLYNKVLGLPPLRSVSPAKTRLRSTAMDAFGYVTGKIRERFEDQLMEIYLRGGLASRLMKRMKNRLQSTPSGSELNDLFNRLAVYSDAKAKQQLGYEPRFDIGRGLQMTVAWLRLHELCTVGEPERERLAAADANLVQEVARS